MTPQDATSVLPPCLTGESTSVTDRLHKGLHPCQGTAEALSGESDDGVRSTLPVATAPSGRAQNCAEDRKPFQSWAETYLHSRDTMPPIDREAFRIRAIQRANTKRMLNGFASIRPTSLGQANRLRHEIAVSDAAKREAARRDMAGQPIELARLYLQRRGYIIVRANMFGGDGDMWSVSGRRQWLTDDELTELAVRCGFTRISEGNDHE